MALRGADPSLWYCMPGAVAAYQPVAAPDALSARQNMAMGGQARYWAAPAVAPTWSPDAGWTFNGTDQYLTTGIVPEFSGGITPYTMLVRFSGATTDGGTLAGEYTGGARFELQARSLYSDNHYYHSGESVFVSGRLSSGVMAVAGNQGYIDGVADGAAIAAGYATTALDVWIANRNGAADLYAGNIQAMAIYSRKLSAAEVWLASQQMAHCDTNNTWNAWSPQRRWFFIMPVTPSGTTMLPGTAATSAATAPYDDDDWTTPDNAKANDGSYAYIDPFSAASAGPNYPGGTLTTVNTTAPYDDLDWDDKTGVGADDTDYASITSGSFDTNVISYLGKAQGYGFAVPARAVITGVEVVVAKSRSAGTSCVDACVQLLDGNGALFGTNKADGATNWPSSITGITYGGAGDMWGLNTSTLTPAIINDADFGVGIAVKATANNVDANVDYITVKVYYNDPTFDTNDYSYLLKASSFAFVIPTEATVTGVKVTIERKAVGTVKDAVVKLLDGSGALQGNDKADTSTAWPTSDTAKDYGGDGDTWGATVTPAVINDIDFGVAIAVKAEANDSAAYIDYVSMTVYYTVSSGTTYNMVAVAAGTGATSTADLARTMSMAPVAAAAGLTPSADLARIIAQAASADAATATGTPTLLSMVMLAAAAAATGATSTADLARIIGYTAAANGVTATSTADLLRIIGQAAAANATSATSTADLARVIAQVAAANGVTVTGDADLTVATLISLAAQVLAAGATSTADLARVIAHTAAANGVTVTSTADLARVIALVSTLAGIATTSDADLTVSGGLIHLAAAIAAVGVTPTADLLKQIDVSGSSAGVSVTPGVDLLKLIGLAAQVDAVTAVSLAELVVASLVEIYRRRIPDAVRVGSRGTTE